MRRRRPPSSWILASLSMVLAAGATLVVRGRLAALEAEAAAAGPGVPVAVSVTDLERGTVLSGGMLRPAVIPRRYLPPESVGSVRELTGRTLAADVAAGEPVTETRLTRGGGPVAALVPEGLRAISVSVPIPAGLVAPGDSVDVLATHVSRDSYTETVAEGVEVLRVLEAPPLESGVGSRAVVLLVAPDVAERLAFAAAFGELALSVAPPIP